MEKDTLNTKIVNELKEKYTELIGEVIRHKKTTARYYEFIIRIDHEQSIISYDYHIKKFSHITIMNKGYKIKKDSIVSTESYHYNLDLSNIDLSQK